MCSDEERPRSSLYTEYAQYAYSVYTELNARQYFFRGLPRDLLVAGGAQEDFNPRQCKMPNGAKPSFGRPVVCRKLGFWHSPVLATQIDGARLGLGDRDYPAGFGSTVPEGLEISPLPSKALTLKYGSHGPPSPIRKTVWKRSPARGAVHASDFDHVIAFVCDQCGAGVDVEE